MKNKPRRKNLRVPKYDYSEPGEYFVTICTQGKKCWFGEVINNEMRLNEIGKIVEKCWQDSSTHYPGTELDEFVIMPNHIHGIIAINFVGAIHESPLRNYTYHRRRMIIPKIIGRFKMNSAKSINKIINNPDKVFWQRNYYEHIIRNDRDLDRIREYILDNPYHWHCDRNNPNF